MRNRTHGWLLACIMLMIALVAGCGGPKPDVTVLVMTDRGIAAESTELLQSSLQQRLGESPTVQLNASPIFTQAKLIVELAAGENGIILVPESTFKSLANQGGYVALDQAVDPKKFPRGVIEMTETDKDQEKRTTALFGIPMDETPWFQQIRYQGEPTYAFVPINAKNREKALRVLQAIAK